MYDIGIPEINVTARSESEDGRAISVSLLRNPVEPHLARGIF